MMAASKTEDYQLLGEVLDQGLKDLGYSREDPGPTPPRTVTRPIPPAAAATTPLRGGSMDDGGPPPPPPVPGGTTRSPPRPADTS